MRDMETQRQVKFGISFPCAWIVNGEQNNRITALIDFLMDKSTVIDGFYTFTGLVPHIFIPLILQIFKETIAASIVIMSRIGN